MSMERIFRDYESQLAAAQLVAIEQDAREHSRAEYAKIQQADRLAAQLGQNLKVNIAGQQVWQGELVNLGLGWIQLRTRTEGVLIPISAISWWEGGSGFSYLDSESVRRKLTFGYALRALSAARIPVRIFHQDPNATSEGTIERVGMDFIYLALHGLEGNYRAKKISGHRTVSMPRIGAVCSLSVEM